MKSKIERVIHKKKFFALIIRNKIQFKKKGVNFLTKNEDLLQVGFLKHNKNHIIKSHVHVKQKRLVSFSSEVLIIKKGELKVNFFDSYGKRISKTKILYKNDIIILFQGGHGFEVKKNCEIIEVKQGPYLKGKDKKLF
ncbi:MAG: hypothetical protein CBB97_14385 [Candidatus Endolissoclinum sp. TMED37]|nr:MAG: hypothetical protein CBB97_14385 [Candidatus Endolissoclinum sp. TMED37]